MANSAKAAPEMHPQDWLLLVFLSALWGGSFFFVGVAIRELPPTTIVLARVGSRGAHPAAARAHLRRQAAQASDRLAALCGDGHAQQRHPVLALGHRADLRDQRHGLGAQRHHAAVHRAGDGRLPRGAAEPAPCCRRDPRPGRRDHPAPTGPRRVGPVDRHLALSGRSAELRLLRPVGTTQVCRRAADHLGGRPAHLLEHRDGRHRQRGRPTLDPAGAEFLPPGWR